MEVQHRVVCGRASSCPCTNPHFEYRTAMNLFGMLPAHHARGMETSYRDFGGRLAGLRFRPPFPRTDHAIWFNVPQAYWYTIFFKPPCKTPWLCWVQTLSLRLVGLVMSWEINIYGGRKLVANVSSSATPLLAFLSTPQKPEWKPLHHSIAGNIPGPPTP